MCVYLIGLYTGKIVDRDKKLDTQILEYVEKHPCATVQDLKKFLKRRYATVWEHVQVLLKTKKLVKVQFESNAYNFKGEKIPIFIEAINQKSGKLVTFDFFQNYRNEAKFRLEDAEAKGEAKKKAENDQLKKKIAYLEALKVPVDCRDLFEEKFRLKDENEKLRELVQIQAGMIDNSKMKGAFQIENVELVDSLKKEIESLRKEIELKKKQGYLRELEKDINEYRTDGYDR
jgi:hypothetical protein